MDAWFIVFLIALFIGTIVVVGAWLMVLSEDDGKGFAAGVTAVMVLIVGFFFFMTTFTTIGVKTVGVTTQFGKTSQPMGSGWHWKIPTAQVHKWDGSLQTDLYSDDEDDKGKKMTVRLAGGGQAFVSFQAQWRVTDKNFEKLFNDYKEFDRVSQNVVKPHLQEALVSVFAPYNPIEELKTKKVGIDYRPFSVAATNKLKEELSGDGISLQGLLIRNVEFDKNTQDGLNDVQKSIINTTKAEQEQVTNEARRIANEKLGSTKVDPCNLLVDLAAKGQLKELPVNAISCGGNGSTAPVIIGQK